jgi:hypothetical protein
VNTQEVSPLNMRLVNITALSLAHLNEVIDQELSIVTTDPPAFFETLVVVEGQNLSLLFKVFGFVLNHVGKSCLFETKEFLAFLLEFLYISIIAPLVYIFVSKKLLFAFCQ